MILVRMRWRIFRNYFTKHAVSVRVGKRVRGKGDFPSLKLATPTTVGIFFFNGESLLSPRWKIQDSTAIDFQRVRESIFMPI